MIHYYVKRSDGYVCTTTDEEEAEGTARLLHAEGVNGAAYGVLIQKGRIYEDFEGVETSEAADTLHQIEEAFPAAAKRLKALDRIEKAALHTNENGLSANWILTIIKAAKQ